MFLATLNQSKQLLYFCYIGKVTPADLKHAREDVEKMLKDLAPGFRLLADLSRVESMDIACVAEIGKTMELLERHQIGLIARVVPDEGKDIGFGIIAAFHYQKRPRTVTCETIEEAAKVLSL